MVCKTCGTEFDGKFCPSCGMMAEVPVQNNLSINQPVTEITPKKKQLNPLVIILPVVAVIIAGAIIFSSFMNFFSDRVSESSKSSDHSSSESKDDEDDILNDSDDEDDTESISAAENVFIGYLEDYFSSVDSIENLSIECVDHSYFSVKFSMEGTAEAAVTVMSDYSSYYGTWIEIRNVIKDTSEKLKDKADEYGLTDYSVSVNVLNDLNTSKTILSFIDGACVYDIVDQENA